MTLRLALAASALSFLALSWALILATGARAHEAHSAQWTYPTFCCWGPSEGRRGDCDMIPDHAVRERPDGYHVTLEPGEHPMVKKPLSVVVPYQRARVAPDGAYHVCFDQMMGVRCFFAGARGS